MFVPACWEALILGAMIKPSVSALRPAAFSHLGSCLGPRQPVSPVVGICHGLLLISTWT